MFLSCPITQHVSTIFIFLATFVRVKQRLLDPRILVWISVVAFAVGYIVWEATDIYLARVLNRQRQRTSRTFMVTVSSDQTLTENPIRREDAQVNYSRIPSPAFPLPSAQDIHRRHLVRHHLGVICMSFHFECLAG